ncbi:hypothetical protein COV13_00225 [Candidatus Woesearchaeota archaeon CG10_big_fil_rev_8_21_14_0_10_32_9]|nr:MAG: hypothetical protein COV13_00225 [Candidatus Woesearchaeota archaeon CG10_big_fil_rev_8_21_14_0_10_32_9]
MTKGILEYSSLIWNNIWSHSHEIAKALGQKYEVYYLEVPENKERGHEHLTYKTKHKVPKGVQLITTNKKFKKFNLIYLLYTQYYTIKKFIQYRNKFQIFITYNTYDVALLYLSKLFKKKIVFMYVDEYEDLTPNSFFKQYLHWTLKIFLKNANLVICTARLLEEKAKTKNKKTKYIPNATNLTKFKLIREQKEKQFTIGFVGTLGSWVDADMIADAAKIIQKKDKSIKIKIIGPGQGHTLLTKRITEENIQNIELKEYMNHEEALKNMHKFHIAIIPFKINKITNSVSPLKLFEYWLSNNAVLSTETYELKQFKKELIFFKDAKDLAEKAIFLKKNKTLREKLAKKGKELVVQKYNWELLEKQYQILIGELL